jgi:hypothetical protein
VKLSISDKATRAFRGIRKFSFLQKLREKIKQMNKARELYRNYPVSPEKFEDWKHNAEKLFT